MSRAQTVDQRAHAAGSRWAMSGAPRRPRQVVVRGLDRHEEGEVVQPRRFRETERLEPIPDRRWCRGVESIEHARPQRLPMGDHGGVVDASAATDETPGAAGALGRSRRIGLGEQSLLDQPIEADEQRIAGERGEALVRRIAIAGRAQRQHLPQVLAGRGEEVEERDRARPQVADAEASRQAGGVEQDAAATCGAACQSDQRCGAASVSLAS